MNTEKAKQLIELYYRCVDLGTPFLSCYPDEFVLTAIIGKVAPEWDPFPFGKFTAAVMTLSQASSKKRKEGIYFYYRQH